MDRKETSYKALIFPWLAHGHIFPFLQLSKKLSNTNKFHIYFLSTSINLDSVRKSLENDENDKNIELVELHLPTSLLPPHHHTTKNIPPHLMPTLIQAFHMSASAFSDIIADLSPDLLVYDGFQPWSAEIASSLGIPSVHFATSASASLSFFHHHYTHKSFDTFPFPEIFLREHEKRDLARLDVDDGQKGFLFGVFELSCDIVLIKSCCRGIEGKYMDYLSGLCRRKIVPTGPLITTTDRNNNNNNNNRVVLDWLSEKSPFSTLYISFGSENYLSGRQMREIAKGLERVVTSDVNFVWVVRSANPKTDDDDYYDLPREFVEGWRRSGRGMFLRGWAPQAEILAHGSVGGFMSHCGWSSVTESVYFGVPILGAPLKLDQPANCRAAVEAGVGVEVMRGPNGEFDGDNVAKAIGEVMISRSGERFRLRARELSNEMKIEDANNANANGFCEELIRVCAKKLQNDH